MATDDSLLVEQSGAFGTASHPAYSSFSHIGDVQNLSFAVGLREDAENAELYVQKILPMCKIVPGKPVARRRRASTPDANADLIEVPEILEMRERLQNILRGNEQLEEERKALNAKLMDAVESLETIEKRSVMLDEEVDRVKEQLMEERNRTLVANLDAEAVKQCHAELNEQVSRATVSLAKLEAELSEKTAQLAALRACSDLEMVFGGTSKDAPAHQDRADALEVTKLGRWPRAEPEDDEDDDNANIQQQTRHFMPRDMSSSRQHRSNSFAERMLDYKRKLRHTYMINP